jgi:capsular exopolysaccharide synthesis family protein
MPQDAGFPEPTSNVPPSRPNVPPVAGRIEPPAPAREPLPPPPALSASPDLGALLRCLRHRWMAALALGVPLAAAAALAAWLLLSPKFTAASQFRVLSENHGPLGNAGAPNNFVTFLKTAAGQLLSRTVIAGALKRDEVRRLNMEGRYNDPAQHIEDIAKAEFTEGSELLTLKYESADPAESVAVVKAMTDTYMDLIVYADERKRAQMLTDLEKIQAEAAENLKRKKGDLKRMADTLGTSDKDVLTQQQVQLIEAHRDAKAERGRLAGDLFKAQAELDAIRARIEAMHRAPVAEADLEALVDTDPDAKDLAARVKRMQTLAGDFGPGSSEPTAVRAREQAAKLKKQLDERRALLADKAKRGTGKRDVTELELARASLENQVGLARDELARREKEVKELSDQIARIGTSSSELEALRGAIRSEEKVVDDTTVKLEQLRLEARVNPPRVSVFQDADLQKKDMKKQLLAAVAAPLAVLFAVCGLLALAEYRQRRVRSAGEVAEGLGIPVVGAVPAARHLKRRLTADEGGYDPAAQPVLESFDALRTLLLHDAGARPRVVLVTSAVAGEGKTTLASHLATSLARAGRKTLLLDGDLRRPAAHQLFELPLQPGFSEVLLAEVEVADALQQSAVPGLWVMTAGQWDREVLQALARDGLEGIFEKLQEEFDFVVVDSHPVLPAADSLLIGRRVDAAILSVLREVSQMPRVYAACQRLASLNIPVLGAVVSGADPEEVFAAPAYAARRVAG